MLQIALFSNFHHNDHVFTLNFNTKLCGGFVYVHLAGLPAGHTALSADADTAITDQNTKTSKKTKIQIQIQLGIQRQERIALQLQVIAAPLHCAVR